MNELLNMKTFAIPLLAALFAFSCSQKSTADTSLALIKEVENGLSNQVYIVGDSTWSIEESMAKYGIPGASIAVIHEGKVAWAKGYGVMDKESEVPVTDKTLFQVSTIGMPLTAYGALSLVSQHKVSLNQDINNYLKSWQLPHSEFTKEKKVTIKNLLSHSAGINVHAFSGYRSNEPVPTLLEILNGTPPAKSNPVIVDKAIDENLWISAGGYTIIQQMMMDVEGKNFPDLMHELVLQPLEMDNSSFSPSLDAEQRKNAATGYIRDGSEVTGKRHIYPELASNGLWTTAEDLAKFVIHIQENLQSDNRNTGVSKELVDLMLTPHSRNQYGQYGLGFSIYDKKDEVYFEYHGWSTGFYSRLAAHRNNDYGVVVLANSPQPGFVFEVFRSVARAYEWDNYAPVYEKIEIDQPFANGITGRYQADNRVVEVYQMEHRLFAKNIINTEPEELIRVSDSTFVRRNASRQIQFESGDENEGIKMLYINWNDETIAATLFRRDHDQKEPVEFLIEDEFDKALAAYRAFIAQDPAHLTITEDYLDDLGHHFLREDRTKISQTTFKLNTVLHPDSYQVYYSYAEACEKAEDMDLAILNYKKSLELNPGNNRARERLKELQKRRQ